ncbi:MAG: glycosyltransferase family 4 protein [Parvibaculaceae bacterium]
MAKIAVLLKGYPRLSETFIAQEILGLERAGLGLVLYSMRHPTDTKRHPVHDEIRAPVHYLPEYLRDDWPRVIKSWAQVRGRPGYSKAFQAFIADYKRDRSRNRVRRFGQALVLAAEIDKDVDWIHAHFIHTPGSVARYASLMTGLPWSCSAHAKDIWTSSDGDLRTKLAEAQWTVTCTAAGYTKLKTLSQMPAKIHLSYHGLDLARFAPNPYPGSSRDGSRPDEPVEIVTVGRAVEKKGFDILISALALLPASLSWRLTHIGGGERLPALKEQAQRLGLAERIAWLGSSSQKEVLERLRSADLFVLPCRIASDGDRDGLPNVLVEAASQRLACISTAVSGVPELIDDGDTGLLVTPENPQELAAAIERAARDPDLRRRLGSAAEKRVREAFDYRTSIATLSALFRASRP